MKQIHVKFVIMAITVILGFMLSCNQAPGNNKPLETKDKFIGVWQAQQKRYSIMDFSISKESENYIITNLGGHSPVYVMQKTSPNLLVDVGNKSHFLRFSESDGTIIHSFESIVFVRSTGGN